MRYRQGSIMMFLLGTVIIMGILYSVNYLNAQHQYRVKETSDVCRDLNILVDEISRHYARFNEAATGYIQSGVYNSSTEATLKNLWGNTGTFAVPNSPENINAMMTRLQFSSEIINNIGLGSNNFLNSCTATSNILLLNEVAPLTTIPVKWVVLITATSTGAGEFDVDTLQDKILQGIKDGSDAVRSTKMTIKDVVEANKSKITIRLEFKITKQKIVNLNVYGM